MEQYISDKRSKRRPWTNSSSLDLPTQGVFIRDLSDLSIDIFYRKRDAWKTEKVILEKKLFYLNAWKIVNLYEWSQPAWRFYIRFIYFL
jgi:hypothetical protein